MTKTKSAFLLLGCIILCQAIGGIGAVFTYPEISNWYASLSKPFFNPPNWIFGPVWTVLFILMGVSLWMILKAEDSPAKKIAAMVFIIQLALNSSWSFIFFRLHSPVMAFITIIILWLAILLWIIKTKAVTKVGALISLPYLAWVSFAGVLNFWIWKLNP